MYTNPIFEHCKCSTGKPVTFSEGQTILTIGDGNGRVGILMDGEAHISLVNKDGSDVLIEVLSVGDSFGEYLMMPVVTQYYEVIADTDCSVSFINFKNILNNCRPECQNHADLVKALLLLTSKRAQDLSLHTNILSQKSIKNKLMLYLASLRSLYACDEFEIPLSLSRLASYLAVDRSAMMREIKKMNDEGLITSSNRVFSLHFSDE